MELSRILKLNNLSHGDAAKITGLNRSTISKIISGDYPNCTGKETEVIKRLNDAGFSGNTPNIGAFEAPKKISIDNEVMVPTSSVVAYNALAADLADPESSLSSSLGMVIGTAERGKTFTSKRFVENNANAFYVLYIDGTSITQLLRDICAEVANTRPHSLSKCITVLEQSCKYNRRLIIIDEADKCPIKHLETLRGINERCNVPFLFVGEEALKSKIDQVPRLRSRVRLPVVVFDAVQAVDIAAYYQMAANVQIDVPTAKALSHRARGGFRTVANEAQALVKMANISGMQDINEQLIKNLG